MPNKGTKPGSLARLTGNYGVGNWRLFSFTRSAYSFTCNGNLAHYCSLPTGISSSGAAHMAYPSKIIIFPTLNPIFRNSQLWYPDWNRTYSGPSRTKVSRETRAKFADVVLSDWINWLLAPMGRLISNIIQLSDGHRTHDKRLKTLWMIFSNQISRHRSSLISGLLLRIA